MKKYLMFILLAYTLLACNGGKNKVDISSVNLELDFIRFDKELFAIPPDTTAIKKALPVLRENYPLFFELYNRNIINIGNSYSEMYPVYLQLFLTNEAVKMAWDKVNSKFADDSRLKKELTDAFKHFRYYFPDRLVPQVYTYISGFGESMSLADSLVGISLDKYLGADFEGYDLMAFPRYLSRRMIPEKIPSDCVRAWGIGEFPYIDESGNTLISKMIYEGKLFYFTERMLPNEPDTLIFGFTNDQLKWCKSNEKNMWAYLIEHKLLFTTDYLNQVKLTEEAPYTSIFPPESPGRACNWIGYRIVERYIKQNKDISLEQLMEDNNHQRIFENARYKP